MSAIWAVNVLWIFLISPTWIFNYQIASGTEESLKRFQLFTDYANAVSFGFRQVLSLLFPSCREWIFQIINWSTLGLFGVICIIYHIENFQFAWMPRIYVSVERVMRINSSILQLSISVPCLLSNQANDCKWQQPNFGDFQIESSISLFQIGYEMSSILNLSARE